MGRAGFNQFNRSHSNCKGMTVATATKSVDVSAELEWCKIKQAKTEKKMIERDRSR